MTLKEAQALKPGDLIVVRHTVPRGARQDRNGVTSGTVLTFESLYVKVRVIIWPPYSDSLPFGLVCRDESGERTWVNICNVERGAMRSYNP